jgi:hypothetical protein
LRDLKLAEPLKEAILVRNRRESGECRLVNALQKGRRFMSRILILAAALATAGFASLAWGEDNCPKKNPIQGEWQAGEAFQSPGGGIIPSLPCYRIYRCVSSAEAHGQQTMNDPACKRVYHYPPARRQVTGVCSAGSGPADSCNVCLTNPPNDPCEYHYKHD